MPPLCRPRYPAFCFFSRNLACSRHPYGYRSFRQPLSPTTSSATSHRSAWSTRSIDSQARQDDIMTTIKLRGLRKVYGSDVVVEDTNLEFGSGDFIVLLGPSGCGKTTTLNMIAGFEAPTDGQVLFDGKSV